MRKSESSISRFVCACVCMNHYVHVCVCVCGVRVCGEMHIEQKYFHFADVLNVILLFWV